MQRYNATVATRCVSERRDTKVYFDCLGSMSIRALNDLQPLEIVESVILLQSAFREDLV